MDIKKELLEILCDYVDATPQTIDTSEGLRFAGLDSFALLSMISSIEEHFSISIPNDVLHGFKTIDDMIVYLRKTLTI